MNFVSGTQPTQPTLVSVDEYNERKRRERTVLHDKISRTGVACPKCGNELLWYGGTYAIPSVYPPPTTIRACCVPCGLNVDLEK